MTNDVHSELFAGLAAQRRDRDAHLQALWAMTPAEREAAMWRRELTFTQLQAWASRRPEEVPLLGGEFAFIAINTPEWAEGRHTHTTDDHLDLGR
jgi:hypothetical protein